MCFEGFLEYSSHPYFGLYLRIRPPHQRDCVLGQPRGSDFLARWSNWCFLGNCLRMMMMRENGWWLITSWVFFFYLNGLWFPPSTRFKSFGLIAKVAFLAWNGNSFLYSPALFSHLKILLSVLVFPFHQWKKKVSLSNDFFSMSMFHLVLEGLFLLGKQILGIIMS